MSRITCRAIALLATATNVNSLVPYLENFPPLPDPLIIRDWKQTALDYHQLAFNPSVAGQFLPLLHEYTANTEAGCSGPAFGLPSYVGNPRDSGEALTALGAVLGSTLAGRARVCERRFQSSSSTPVT